MSKVILFFDGHSVGEADEIDIELAMLYIQEGRPLAGGWSDELGEAGYNLFQKIAIRATALGRLGRGPEPITNKQG